MNYAKSIRLYIRFVIKLFVFLVLGFVWCKLAFGIIYSQVPSETEAYMESEAFVISLCDKYYYEMNYENLFEILCIYSAYDEQYDVYWEVMDAYIALQECEKWQKISEDDIADARIMEKMYHNQVIEAYENCRFPQNQKFLDDFVEMLE